MKEISGFFLNLTAGHRDSENAETLPPANCLQTAGNESENGPKTPEAIEADTRTLRPDLTWTPVSKMGGSGLSARQALSFTDGKGRRLKGLFTPKTYTASVSGFSAVFEKCSEKAKTKRGKALLSGMIQKIMAKFTDLESDRDAAWDLINFARKDVVTDEQTGEVRPSMQELDAGKLVRYIGAVTDTDPDDAVNEIGAQNLADLTEELEPLISDFGLNISNAGIPEGGRIDRRSAAMSAAADLLGCSGVIARSSPMVIRDQNGNEAEGTFMLEAKGLDYENPSSDADKVDANSLKDTDGQALRDLADLQVLDYICGNIDRHQGNMIYRFNADSKLIGVQGIDNDCSFGTKIPVWQGQNHLAAPKDMIAVTESMYKKVSALSPEELEYALRGFDLSDAELQAAGSALKS